MSDEFKGMYPRSEYTFVTDSVIKDVLFSETHMIVELLDGRYLGIPLTWIPTLLHATPADRERYFLGNDRKSIHWNPEDGPVNEDLRLRDYLKV